MCPSPVHHINALVPTSLNGVCVTHLQSQRELRTLRTFSNFATESVV